MKKILTSLMVFAISCSLLVGCGTSANDSQPSVNENFSEVESNESSGSAALQTSEADMCMDVLLYLPNDQADGFTEKNLTLDLNPQSIIDALIENNVLPEESAIQVFHLQNDGTSRSIALDMNEIFGTAAGSLGTSGETMIVGSLVNSMLSAYGAEYILLSVDGQPLTTGHSIYDEPISFME